MLEEVIVRGIRGSLERSMDLKRDAAGVVDAISAEDIGKFPDTNLAESLQRITGVSIDRRDGEGSQVTIRGFGGDSNLVLLNGRQMPSADQFAGSSGAQGSVGGSPRSFNFANLASEGISGIEVFKTSRANLATGGIGGTINIKTMRPLDNPGMSGSIGFKAVNDTTTRIGDDITPEVSGVFSWTDDSETIGVSLSASYQERDSAAAQVAMNNWNIGYWGTDTLYSMAPGGVVENAPADGQLYARPNDVRYAFSDRHRERTNAQLTVQFRPMDSLTLTGDYTYAENYLQEHRGEQTFWIANGNSVSYVSFDDGAVASPIIIEEANLTNKDTGHEQQWREQTNELSSFGFNLDWQINDSVNLNFDFHDSTAESVPTGPAGSGSLDIPVGVRTQASQRFDFSGEIPIVAATFNDGNALFDGDGNPILLPDGSQRYNGNNNGQFDLGDVGTQLGRIWYAEQTTDVQQARINTSIEFDNGRFDFGIDSITSESNQKSSNNQMTFGDWGINDSGEIPAEFLELFCVSCQFDDASTSGATREGLRADPVALMQWLVAEGQAGNYGDPASYSFALNPTLANNDTVEEDIQAFYFQFNIQGELGSMPTNLLIGTRYESTDVTSSSQFTPPNYLEWQDNNDFFAVRPVGASDSYSEKFNYDHVLPSIDFDISLREDLKGRVSFSKTISRPGRTQLSPTVGNFQKPGSTLLTDIASADSSNPELVPLESDNFDISLEWYYGDASYASVGLYEKRVSNFIGTEQVIENHFGMRDVTAGPRAQQALQELTDRNIGIDDTSLFVMTALIDNGIDPAVIEANLNNPVTDRTVTNAYAVSIATQYDIQPDASDPLMDFRTSKPVNNREAKISGSEWAVQHFFGDTGFGVQANYTFVNGDVSIDNLAAPDATQFALVGLSDTANLVAIYENFGFQARLAYNWRDEFLTEVSRGSGNSPRYTEEYSQVDLNLSYDVTDSLNVFFEGLNVTGEDVRQHGRNERQIWFYEELGPRYTVGARYSF